MATVPQYGAQGGFIRSSKGIRSDQAELVSGLSTLVFVRSTRTECSASTSECAWGITPVDGVIIDTARLTIEDEPDMNFTAAQIGVPNQTDVLTKVKCCVIKRARVTIAIDGKGDPGWALGSSYIPTIVSAIGNQTMADAPADMRCVSYSVTDTDRDWQKFQAEFQGYIDGTGGGSSIAETYIGTLTPPNCDGVPPSCLTFRYEESFNGEGYAEKTVTKTINPMKA